jgi:hypothetical protein
VRKIEEIMIVEGNSITHNDEEEMIGLDHNLEGSLPASVDEEIPTYEINRIIIGRGNINVDSSIESDRNDEFQKLKNLNVSAIKNEPQHHNNGEADNLFGSINAVIGGHQQRNSVSSNAGE